MRAKQLWANFSFLRQVKLVWDRITVSRLTIGYFVFSVIHCLIQTGFQARVFALNAEGEKYFNRILQQANATLPETFPVITEDVRFCTKDNDDSSCFVVWDGMTAQPNYIGSFDESKSAAPSGNSSSSGSGSTTTSSASQSVGSSAATQSVGGSTSTPQPAPQVAGAVASAQSSASTSSSSSSSVAAPTNAAPTPTSVNNASDDLDDLFETPDAVDVGEFGDESASSASGASGPSDSESDSDVEALAAAAPAKRMEMNVLAKSSQTLASFRDGYYSISLPQGEAQLTEACVRSLNYPVFALQRTEREDAAFIIFNFWVLGMSVVAILNESIPHMLASLLTHVLATAWAGFQISHTQHFNMDYHYAVANGACAGAPKFLEQYWIYRSHAEIPALALNVLALFISAGLTYYLIKVYGWKTFKRIGASLQINRLYKLVLVLSIAMQLSLFFICLTVSLWVDQLFNGPPCFLADHKEVYQAISIITIIMVVPWLVCGWTGARREDRLRMGVFLVLSVLYVAAWTLQFLSHTFQWQFLSWPFFRMMTVVALLLTALTLALGVYSRINFGKGLPNYLKSGSDLPDATFEPYYLNKGDEEKGSFDEKVEFPNSHPSLQQYPFGNDEHHTAAYPVATIAAPPPAKKKLASGPGAKLAPNVPTVLRGVPRYQNLFTNNSSGGGGGGGHKRQLSTEFVSSPTSGPRPLVLAGEFQGLQSPVDSGRIASYYEYESSRSETSYR